ncbi:transglycosylase SLT domain-containing protein [Candidatus Desantisbacteria bacterium]|nr:transglycosylase SLT domain-containing protein [Candidatus Desantisbacteria bacterium]
MSKKMLIIIVFLMMFQFSCSKNNVRTGNDYTRKKLPETGSKNESKMNKTDCNEFENIMVNKNNSDFNLESSSLNFETTISDTKENSSKNNKDNVVSGSLFNTADIISNQAEIIVSPGTTDDILIDKDKNDEEKRKEILDLMKEHYNRALLLYNSGEYEESKNEFKISLRIMIDSDLETETFFKLAPFYKNIFDSSECRQVAVDENSCSEDPNVNEFNQEVVDYINKYKTNYRKKMLKRLSRSTRYIGKIREIFENEGLAQDLAYLPMIESDFAIRAHSKEGAAGLWQFTKKAGKKYNLRMDSSIDERYDPVISTIAVAKKIKDLYKTYDSILLSEVGEFTTLRTVGIAVTHNLQNLTDQKDLSIEARKYIADFVANLVIAKNPEKYGFEKIEYALPLEYDEVSVNGDYPLSICAKAAQCSLQEIKDLNPALLLGRTPTGDNQFILKIPGGKSEIFNNAIESGLIHIVRPGETMLSIALKYNI